MKDPPKSKERGAYALVNRKEEEERGNILAEHAEKDEEADELEDVSDYLLEKNEPLDPEAEKRLVKKIDRRIMPILIAMIVLNYLDRNALANARIQGIETSLGLTGSQFNTSISVFFIGYIGLQVPSNLLLTRVRPSIYLPSCMIAWGCLSGFTSFVSSFRGLVLTRFLLGFVEAPFFPGALFLLSSWYTKKELAFRTAVLYSGSLMSGAFGGFVGAGIEAGLHGFMGWESWRWLFVIEASATIVLAVGAMFVLPDYPATTRWLLPSERRLAARRLQSSSSPSHHGIQKQGLLNGLKQAMIDPNVALLALIILTKTSAGAVTSFIPTLVATFKLSRVATLLLVAPPYVTAAITGLVVSRSSDKHGERSLHIIVPITLGLAGFAIFGLTLNAIARYLSMFLMLSGVYGSYNVALAWISTTIPEPVEKKSAAYAIINTVGNMAQIYSPYFYLAENGPRYAGAMVADAGFCLACVALVWVLRTRLKRENKRLLEAHRYLI